MGLEFSKQVPLRASPAISQVTKRGSANLALHNLLSIPHRKLERHQVGIIPNGLSSPQRHEPGPLFPTTREADRAVGCQVSIYKARRLTFLKQRSKACPQRFANSRPAGIAGDVTEIDPALVLQRAFRSRPSRGNIAPPPTGKKSGEYLVHWPAAEWAYDDAPVRPTPISLDR